MGKIKDTSEDNKTTFLFLVIPTIMLITSYFLFPYEYSPTIEEEHIFKPVHILIIISIACLGAGYFTDKKAIGKKLKISGWIVFGVFWSTQPSTLYYSEQGDIFNAVLCVIGVYVLFYFAYHEWLSLERKEENKTLNWIAGAACLAAVIYYGVEKTSLALWLRQVVAAQSGWLLHIITGEEVLVGGLDNLHIFYKTSHLYLIFACTSVQAMVIFVGILVPLKSVSIKRRIYGLLVTLIPVYILNLLRNAMISFLVGNEITDFTTAHNYVAKAGSMITLIVLLLVLIKIIPEVFEEINNLIDLPKRNGPLERVFSKYIWRKK